MVTPSPLLSVHALGKCYPRDARYRVMSLHKGVHHLFKRRPPEGEFWALRDTSFTLQPGESLGIVGPNGSGKSTLCRLISRIIRPTHGSIQTSDSAKIIGLVNGVGGFNSEISGRNNLVLIARYFGMSKQDFKSHFESIVEFSGLRNFLDLEVKHYSKGMNGRLTLSVIAHMHCDVLVLDEGLGGADSEFTLKVVNRLKAMQRGGTSLIIVTHNPLLLKEMCPRSLLLKSGKLILDSTTTSVLDAYEMCDL